MLVPRGDAHPDDPTFTYYAPFSLLGSVGPWVRTLIRSKTASTAGTVAGRRVSMTAFPTETAILLDRGTGATFAYTLESIPGVTSERTIWSSGGSGLGSLRAPRSMPRAASA